MGRSLIMAVGALLLCRNVLAETMLDAEAAYFGDLPVVLSASRLLQTVEDAPASVTVIDRQMIRASGVREIVDLFRLVPGMVVGMYKGHQATMGFPGFTDPYFRQLQVLIDGVSIYSPMWGGAEWSELPIALEDIERIEVVRGPNAATFGANSFLGVINIITRDPATEIGTEAAANIGENGIGDVLVRHAASSGDLRYRVTAGQRSDQGLDSHPDSRRSNFMNLRSHYRLTTEDELRLQAGYVGGSQGEGVYSLPNHTDGARPRYSDAGSVQLRWTHVRATEEELWLQFSHAERNNRETLPYVLDMGPFGTWNYPLSQSYDHRRTDLELQHTTRLGEATRAVWGAQWRSDGARSMAFLATDDWLTSNLFRVFGNLEWHPAAQWTVSGGAMFEKNSMTGSSWSPSVAINRQVLPGHTLRLRMANARRTPTLFEQNLDWRFELPAGLKAMMLQAGPPYAAMAGLPLAQTAMTVSDLADERIRSREISYLGDFPQYRFSVELDLYQHQLNSLTGVYHYSYPTVMGALNPAKYLRIYGYDNLDSARVTGSSLSMRWHPQSGSLVYLAAARTRIVGTGPNSEVISASGPGHTASLLLSQDFADNWQGALGYYRVGAMQQMSGGDALPATTRVDLSLVRRFKLGSARGEVALTVQNATGSVPLFELKSVDRRTSFVSIRYQY
jgi:iron complex outermembrane recepter protein